MKKQLMMAALCLCGTALFAQTVTGLTNSKKNEKGEYVNKSAGILYSTLQFSEKLKPGLYKFTMQARTDLQLLVWANGKNTFGGYEFYEPVKDPQLILKYVRIGSDAVPEFRLSSKNPKGSNKPINGILKDMTLTPLAEIPADLYPNFQEQLALVPDGEHFLYVCPTGEKPTVKVTKETDNGTPVMQVEGLGEKDGQSTFVMTVIPGATTGTLTVKFSGKSMGGSTKMFVLMRDMGWKFGGKSQNYTFTEDWKDYTFTINCAEAFKPGIQMISPDFRFGPGVYQIKNLSITYAK